MMYRTGLLMVSSLSGAVGRLPGLLQGAAACVRETLYVQLDPVSVVPASCQLTELVTQTYTKASAVCGHLDLNFLLVNVEPKSQVSRLNLRKSPEVVIVENQEHADSIKSKIPTILNSSSIPFKVLDTPLRDCDIVEDEFKTYDYVVAGGTFDRLHSGHKILLSQCCLLCNKEVTIGVTDGAMNLKKKLYELMEPTSDRIRFVKDFLKEIKPGLEYDVVPITDPFGPTITRGDLQCLVVSQETSKGGAMVNKEREKRSMDPLVIETIDLVDDPHHTADEENKVSSSSYRKRLLGTLIKSVKKFQKSLEKLPYVIGFTGGIASGKSSVCRRLEKLGAAVIDCDKLGRLAYEVGQPAFHEIVKEFGENILTSSGRIDTKILGPIVFSDKEKLKKLNSIVWPVIAESAKKQIDDHHKKGTKVVILDAAVLLEAGWDTMTHEVWTTVIPQDEAARRIVERDRLAEDEARRRITSQISNQERVNQANVVLSTLWAPEVTQHQVEKAWRLLNDRIKLL